MFKVNNKLTKELVEKFDNDSSIFYRFQNPNFEIEGEYTQSWGMIFSSAKQARECAEEWGYTEDEAILPGKSCMNSFKGVMNFSEQFYDDDVLLVFKGQDTYVTGHDGEFVAEYEEPIAVFSMQDALEFYEKYYEE